MHTSEHRVFVSEKIGDVSSVLLRPHDARCLYVLAHGAGAGMHHAFMEAIAHALADERVATLRYQFPFTEAGGRRPDHKSRLVPTVRAAIGVAHQEASDLPLFAGGKSMGGRMTSQAVADEPITYLRGLVFVGFPLHPAKKSGSRSPGSPVENQRADHLQEVDVPLLFLQGTRDALADLALLRPICKNLAAVATLHVVEGADHGFHVPKRSGRTDEQVICELAKTASAWMLARLGTR